MGSFLSRLINYGKKPAVMITTLIITVVIFGFIGLLLHNQNTLEADAYYSDKNEDVIKDEVMNKDDIKVNDTELDVSKMDEILENDPATEVVKRMGFGGYTGYLDECSDSNYSADFINCDYDGDGLNDRVYRSMEEDLDYSGYETWYRIEFGNGDKLQLDKKVPDTGFPYVLSIDITGDGINEIVFALGYWTSTNPPSFGEIILYKKNRNIYIPMEMPFQMSELGYTATIACSYELAGENSLEVSNTDTGFREIVEIDPDIWKNYTYKEDYVGETYQHCVWKVIVEKESDDSAKLLCDVQICGRYGVDTIITIGYKNGRLFLEKMELND